jgi:SNF2 family DNA or RNA helicase
LKYLLKIPYDITKPGDKAQIECLKRALKKNRYGVFFQQRVGKTRVAIDFIGYKIAEGAKRVLVLCPLCAQASWKVQFKEYLGNPGVRVILGTLKTSNDYFPLKTGDEVHIIISTYEKMILNFPQYTKWNPEVVIFDEVHLLKNRNSKRSKMAHKLSKSAKAVLGLTGTPYSNKKYADLFGIFRAINQDIFGSRWVDFEREYCIMGGYMGYEIVGYRNEEKILELVNKNSMRVLRKDIMKEPEQEDIKIYVDLTYKELEYYKQMEKQCILYLEEQPKVTADMVTTQRIKLQQITSGVVKGDDGKYYEVGESKLNVTINLIKNILDENDNSKIVVCCRYIQDIARLRNKLIDAVIITGRDSSKARDEKLELWRNSSSVHVLIIQEQCMSMGLDLSISNNMIFYSWGEDSVTHSQVRDRLMGRFQKSDVVHYYYMICNYTIDTILYKTLKSNISFAEQAANWRKWVISSEDK